MALNAPCTKFVPCSKTECSMNLKYDVIVIGAGHAGCEAAMAAAQLGAKTCLITIDMNKIAQMSCNPAIGGIAKGQIVREVDALGGHMGLVADATTLHFRMLNRSKGPAMWSPRAQCDRFRFIEQWRQTLDRQDHLDIWQDVVEELLVDKEQHATGVRTQWGVTIEAKSVVITAGTFLNGLMHIGKKQVPGGRIAEFAVAHLTDSITQYGIRTARMKTGTPVRIDRRSVDFSMMERQEQDEQTSTFSYMPADHALSSFHEALPCWITYTNSDVHRILNDALPYSPLYNGQINSIGPRYCPSIETKLVTFPERNQHLLFLEPEGADSNEMYLNGFSSSMPADVQIQALRQIPAFRNLKVYRPGYAIEYDIFDPTQLKHTLESKVIGGLFLAGQINGTTGYEEAAGQGLVAGVNASLHCSGNSTFTLARNEAYIGVLIDDLVTKGVDEPYRMFTSRAEYRILLRQDNADTRLTQKAYDIGLATKERWQHWQNKQQYVNNVVDYCRQTKVKPSDINTLLEQLGTTPLHQSVPIAELIARPQLSIRQLIAFIPGLNAVTTEIRHTQDEVLQEAEIILKYQGYIDREQQVVEKMQRLENIRISPTFDFNAIDQLTIEARQKLSRIQPATLAQASRIPGVSPNDINVLLVLLGR